MSDKQSVRYVGPGLGTLLTVVFVTLKLTGMINWSWWLVLAPTLIPFGLSLLFLFAGGVVIAAIASSQVKTPRRGSRRV